MWSGAARSTPINDKTDRKKPSAWRTGTRKTRRSVNAVSIAQSENVFGAPGRPDGDGRHASVASAESHSVTSPRWTKACSYADQFPTLAAKAMVFPPGPPPLHVVGGEELALGDDSRAKQLCDLLRVGEVSLVSTHLPGLAHPKGRQRIDHVIPKCVLLKEGTARLPHVPGRLEREVHLSSSPADTRRAAALHKLVETLPGMWNLEARETAALRIEDDDLLLAGRQIDTHEEIV